MEEKDQPVIHKKKRVLTIRSLETKLAAIADVEAGLEPKVNIARKYDIPPNTLSTWIKNADRIKAASQAADFRPHRKKLRTTPYDDIDKALYEWYMNARSVDVSLTYRQLQSRAEQIAEEMGYQRFRCSNGWVHRFKERYKLLHLDWDDASGQDAVEARLEDIDPIYYDTLGQVEDEEEDEEELIYELIPVKDENGEEMGVNGPGVDFNPLEGYNCLGSLMQPNLDGSIASSSFPADDFVIKQEPDSPLDSDSDNDERTNVLHDVIGTKKEILDSPPYDCDMPQLQNELEIETNSLAKKRDGSPDWGTASAPKRRKTIHSSSSSSVKKSKKVRCNYTDKIAAEFESDLCIA